MDLLSFSGFSLLSDLDSWDIFNLVGVGFNFLAAVILACALFPPFLDTRRSKMTYGLSDGFFLYYSCGGLCMLINAIVNLVVLSNGSFDMKKLPLIILFGIFFVVNSMSVYINFYILKTKKSNMKAAAAKGISEQEYWETYLRDASSAKIEGAAAEA